MKAIIRRQGTIYGTWCYVGEVSYLVPMSKARIFDSYAEAGEWCDEHRAEGPFVIEPADG